MHNLKVIKRLTEYPTWTSSGDWMKTRGNGPIQRQNAFIPLSAALMVIILNRNTVMYSASIAQGSL